MRMSTLAKREVSVVIIAVIVLLILLIPAVQYSRQEVRDGIRRDEVAAGKRVLEDYFNEHGAYPLVFDAAPHEYVVVVSEGGAALEWFIRAQLENTAPPESGYNPEEERNFHYRVVNDRGQTYYEVCGGSVRCDLRGAGARGE